MCIINSFNSLYACIFSMLEWRKRSKMLVDKFRNNQAIVDISFCSNESKCVHYITQAHYFDICTCVHVPVRVLSKGSVINMFIYLLTFAQNPVMAILFSLNVRYLPFKLAFCPFYLIPKDLLNGKRISNNQLISRTVSFWFPGWSMQFSKWHRN